jgi:hypothetical protein
MIRRAKRRWRPSRDHGWLQRDDIDDSERVADALDRMLADAEAAS